MYSIVSEPGDTPDYKNWKINFIAAILFGSLLQLVWVLVYLSFAEYTVAIIMAASSFVVIVTTVLLHLRKIPFDLAKYIIFGITLMNCFLATLAIGGIPNSGGLFLYIMLVPFGVVVISAHQFVGLFIVSVSLVLLEAALQPWLRSSNNIPLGYSTVFWVLNFLTLFGIVFASLISILRHLNKTLRLLHQEQLKSENLLLNILPSEVAQVLKNEVRIIADQIDQASILFADIVNFTPMSASMTPAELVSLLDEVFSQIDAMVERYDLETIKTIGDCYMVAAGIPRPRSDHAHVLAQLALEIQDYVKHNAIQGKQIQFRIGINSGPVVAGVIGRKKFSYDQWGDAVNTASRMESHGTPGLIQITRSTYEIIKDDFICEPLGEIIIKGKGKTAVWQLVRPA